MKRTLLLVFALTAIPLTAALAQAPAPAAMTADQIVAARESGFILSRGSFVTMKAAAEAGVDPKQLVGPSRSLARWARTIPTLFPADTNLPSSHAAPTVWSDRAGFEARAAAYADAARQLAETAQTGDRAAFLTQWSAVAATCAACHETYKNPD